MRELTPVAVSFFACSKSLPVPGQGGSFLPLPTIMAGLLPLSSLTGGKRLPAPSESGDCIPIPIFATVPWPHSFSGLPAALRRNRSRPDRSSPISCRTMSRHCTPITGPVFPVSQLHYPQSATSVLPGRTGQNNRRQQDEDLD
jgi:hypothetical protein